MRKFILILLAGFVSLSGLMVTTTAAEAAPRSPKCMTKAEWRKIKPGMTRGQVKRIVGYNGKTASYSPLIYGDGWSTDLDVDYRQCNKYGKPARGSWNTVTMSYENYEWTMEIENAWHPFSVQYKGGWSTPWSY